MIIRFAVRAAFTLFCAGVTVIAPLALAQDKIDRPVKLLVGFPAGGTADLIARVVADKMKDSLGQPVIVETRAGAIGRIAADAVKAAAPDGTTIMVMAIGPMVVVPHVYADITARARSRSSRARGPGARPCCPTCPPLPSWA